MDMRGGRAKMRPTVEGGEALKGMETFLAFRRAAASAVAPSPGEPPTEPSPPRRLDGDAAGGCR
jgi:hypothetical protein